MSQENVEIVRRAYDSFHPEIEFHTYATSPEAGSIAGWTQ